jgi:CcmD family protein
MNRTLAVLFLLGIAAEARAVEPRCFENVQRWSYDRGKETLAAPGERFLDDLRACDASFAASVTEAIRYRIHAEETEKLARASGYVMAAYGVAWALLALSAVALFLRQRRLARELEALEAKLREAEGRGA